MTDNQERDLYPEAMRWLSPVVPEYERQMAEIAELQARVALLESELTRLHPSCRVPDETLAAVVADAVMDPDSE